MKTIIAKIDGMTCSSCEVIIERKLMKLEGVSKVHVSLAKKQAEIECNENVQLQDLQSTLVDYNLSQQDPIENPPSTKRNFYEIGSVLVVMVGAYILLSQLNLIPNLGVTENMSYGFVFLIGLVAATSTCLAVAGGLLLAVAGKYNEKYPDLTGWQKFRPHIYFNTGRIIGYTILGGTIGYLGSFLTISPSITGALTIAASVFMILIGLQMLHVFPSLEKIQIKMPKIFAHKIYDASHGKVNNTSSFLLGTATFFLPCGFTQALQLYVLGKGGVIVGALTMLAFSIGTLPTLAGIGAFSSFSKGNLQRNFMTFSAILVIVLGIFNIAPGFTLLGVSATSDAEIDAEIIGDKQIVNLEVRGLDYYPTSFIIKKDVPVEFNVDGRSAIGCGQILSIPELGITEQLPRDKIKTISFTPKKTGKITFSCSMGMAGPGVFKVVP